MCWVKKLGKSVLNSFRDASSSNETIWDQLLRISRWWNFKDFLEFSPLFGEDEPILTNIFQRGWFNHQLDFLWFPKVLRHSPICLGNCFFHPRRITSLNFKKLEILSTHQKHRKMLNVADHQSKTDKPTGKKKTCEQWKKTDWLGYIGDYTTQLYRDYSKPLSGSLFTNQYNGKYPRVFSVAHVYFRFNKSGGMWSCVEKKCRSHSLNVAFLIRLIQWKISMVSG